ncbi:hypothetical protein RYZ27_13215 [Hyphomonas sp. FCG-A18]|uniref:hypothetical protein n=1 Tax=Hyphomonas sp. FCG-A18 TaxID=3080019 RepID=UPI002B2BF359|nr:hypothetical protein RYZ27_13215 [Hyphomonas sp. FCG-A18]
MAFEFPIWLLWVISGSGACLMVYVLIQWRKGWEACRPMPFHRRRRRYARGLIVALALLLGPHYLAAIGDCTPGEAGACKLEMYASL